VVLFLQILVRSVLLGNQADCRQGYVSGGNVGKVQMLEAQYDDAGRCFLQRVYKKNVISISFLRRPKKIFFWGGFFLTFYANGL
jgi:hypothetical protein